MGKAARNRARAAVAAAQDRVAGGPAITAPGIEGAQQVFPNFPYAKKFTQAEVADITRRSTVFADLMRDGVALTGAGMFIPEDVFQLWMVHGVMAGADGGQPYIRARKIPDEHGALADRREWVLIKEDTDEQRQADADAEAKAELARMHDRLRPEVRAAIMRQFQDAANQANEYLADDPDGAARRADPDFGAPKLIQHTDEEGSDDDPH